MAIAIDGLVYEATMDFLRHHPPNSNYNGMAAAKDLMGLTVATIESMNITLPKSQRMKPPNRLYNFQIALLIEYYEPVICISCDEDNREADLNPLGVYQTDGPLKGTYDTTDVTLDRTIETYYRMVDQKDLKEIKHILRRHLPAMPRCTDRDLIAVNNGIFNYQTKQLLPFDPEKIFLTKSHVDYNPNAQNIIIHNPDDGTDWDVESWMAELSNDPEIVALLWQILGAILRPFVRWGKSAWLYSSSGNSGKGTLCELMRNLCGKGSYASIALKDFAKEFQLEPLLYANSVIVDENDVGIYLDKVANLKAVITNDALLINRKFKTPITYQFFGFMVQCLNEYPRFRDRSNSFFRRQLFIPFDKCFTGTERKYIKEDYLSRREVLEYVLFRVLNMDYYELSEPAACREMLDDLKIANSPVCEFVEDILPQCRWDLLPFRFLFDLYKAWFAKMNPGGSVLGYQAFIRELLAVIERDPEWECKGKNVLVATKNRMDGPELLILRYNLTDWMNPKYKGEVPDQICLPSLSAGYRGLVRKNTGIALPESSD